MVGVGEHVHGTDGAHLVTAFRQLAHVAGLSRRVARDVDDALGSKRCRGLEELRRRAGPRRIHEQDEGLRPLFRRRQLLHERGGVLCHELGVFHAVVAGVVGGVANGRRHGIDADDSRGPAPRGHEPDGTRAAIGVDDRLGAVKVRQADGLVVEHLGLCGVHLVERLRRDAKGQPAQRVQNETGTVEYPLLFAQDDIGLARVHVLHDGGHLGHAARKLAAEGLRRGKLLAVGHHGDEHFPTLVAHAHHGVAHETGAGVLVVGLHAPAGHDVADGERHLLGRLVLDGAGIGGNEPVGAGLVHTREDVGAGELGILSLAICALGRGVRGDHLVAVMEGVVHAQNGQQDISGGNIFEEGAHLLFLRGQLVFVGHVQPAAAAATSEGGTQGARRALPRIVGGLGQGATKVAPYGGL